MIDSYRTGFVQSAREFRVVLEDVFDELRVFGVNLKHTLHKHGRNLKGTYSRVYLYYFVYCLIIFLTLSPFRPLTASKPIRAIWFWTSSTMTLKPLENGFNSLYIFRRSCFVSFMIRSLHSEYKKLRWSSTNRFCTSWFTLLYEDGFKNRRLRRFSSFSRTSAFFKHRNCIYCIF